MASPLAASYEACRKLTQRTAKNFHFTFLTLGREKYAAMCALYAFMRITDDIGDSRERSLEQRRIDLADWKVQVQKAIAGEVTDHPVLPAFADTVRRYSIPWDALQAVMTGVERDLGPVRVQSFAELEDYCYHVAGAVGLCCIHIWGFTDPEAIPIAVDCGFALQLTNILRDVEEDRALGRVYLPEEDLRRFHYSYDDLAASICDNRFRDLIRFEADRARSSYRRAKNLTQWLHPDGRPILQAMLEIYGGLLEEIEKRNFNVFGERVSLPPWKKLWIAGKAYWSAGHKK